MATSSQERFVQYKLQLDGKELPPSIPFVYPDDCLYDPQEFCIQQLKQTSESAAGPKTLLLAPEALQLLRSVKKPIAVVSICGPYRTGKSYFLSRVIGCKQAFELGHSAEACTKGIWLSTVVLECDDFVVLFLDSEGANAVGEGETSENFTASILTLTTLLSSFLIYNSNNVPTKNDLHRLTYLTELAKSILIRGAVVEDSQMLRNNLPSFLWLLRNVDKKMCDEDGETELSATDYITKCVLRKGGKKEEKILEIFPSFECLKVSRPYKIKPKELINHDDKPSKFNDDINRAIKYIKAHVNSKTGYKTNISITGSSLAILAEEYVKAINTPGTFPDLERSWMAVVKKQLSDTVETLVEEYAHDMSKNVSSKLPMERKSLLDIHTQVLNSKQEQLREKIHSLLPQANAADTMHHTKKLTSRVVKFKSDGQTVESGKLLQFTVENEKESRIQCKHLCQELKENPDIPLSERIESYNKRAVGPAKDEVYQQEIGIIPGKPENVTALNKTHDTIELAWDTPKIHCENAKEYSAQFCLDGKWSQLQTTIHRSVRFKDLKPATEFRFCIRSINETHKSEKAIIDVSTNPGPPVKPIIISFDVLNCTQGRLTCKAPKEGDENGSPINEMISVISIDDNESCVEQRFNVSTEDIGREFENIIQLPNVVDHCRWIHLKVFWKNSVGHSKLSDPISLEPTDLIPGPPQKLRTVGRTHNTIKIRFDSPIINPVAVDHYLIRFQKESLATKDLKKTKHHSVVAMSLDSNTEYIFYVTSHNRGNKHCADSTEIFMCKTKLSKVAAGLATVGAATVGGAGAPMTGAAIVPLVSTVSLIDGIEEQSASKIAGGVVGLLSSPITVPLGFLGGIATSPVGAIGSGIVAHEMLADSDDDLEDSDIDDEADQD